MDSYRRRLTAAVVRKGLWLYIILQFCNKTDINNSVFTMAFSPHCPIYQSKARQFFNYLSQYLQPSPVSASSLAAGRRGGESCSIFITKSEVSTL